MEEAALGLLHEGTRHQCPICGSRALTLELTARDLSQLKPGRFRLDRCEDCGTIFQNPRLSLAGLDFYYRDFYDGVSAEHLERIFAAETSWYGDRVDLVERFAEPRRWLDVGTGHGHFCLVARQRWPKARVEGLDMTDAIEEAERRGWVDRGHRGLFPELAPGLAGAYDVVSMHHYLEHTRDPAAELDAAAVALEPGGFLEIEVPDPESPLRRVFRNAWMPYFQPQHQHLIPAGTLEGLLAERGFTTLAVQRAEAHQPVDVMFAVALTVNRLAPLHDVPWASEAPTVARRVARNALMGASAPLVALGAGIDRGLRPLIAARWPNTYRLVARYDGGS
jgi:SAM-dependent methyltransferase